MKRVFMCTAGTCGERMCATSEMPERMEARVLVGAGDLLAELRAELAVHGRDVDADLLEHPAAHDRHHAAAAVLARLAALALPGLALEAAGRQVGVRAGELGLDLLELGADAVAQRFEPGARVGFALIEVGHARAWYPSVWRRASLNTIAAASATLSERAPFCSGHADPEIGRVMDLGRHAGALAAEQQDVVGARSAASGRAVAPAVVSRTSRPGRRSRRKAAQEAWRRSLRQVDIVHGGAADAPVVDRKAARLDDVERRCPGRRPGE